MLNIDLNSGKNFNKLSAGSFLFFLRS